MSKYNWKEKEKKTMEYTVEIAECGDTLTKMYCPHNKFRVTVGL